MLVNMGLGPKASRRDFIDRAPHTITQILPVLPCLSQDLRNSHLLDRVKYRGG